MTDTLFAYGKLLNPLYFVADISQNAAAEQNRIAKTDIDITTPSRRDIAIREWAKLVQRFGTEIHAVKLYGYRREYHITEHDDIMIQIKTADDSSYVNGILYTNVPSPLAYTVTQERLYNKVREQQTNLEFYANSENTSLQEVYQGEKTNPNLTAENAHKTILSGIIHMSTTDKLTDSMTFLADYYETTYKADDNTVIDVLEKDSTYETAVRMLQD